MAYSNWIKIEHITPDKSEVLRISEITELSPDEVLGKLIRVWIWADQNSTDGNTFVTTKSAIDHVVRHQNFAQAMEKVGWLTVENGVISITNFERHNSESSKKRAKTRKKVNKHRIEKCNQNVTKNPSEVVTSSSSMSMSLSESISVRDESVREGEVEPVSVEATTDPNIVAGSELTSEFMFRGSLSDRHRPEFFRDFVDALRTHGLDKRDEIFAWIVDPGRRKREVVTSAQMFKFWNHFDWARGVGNGSHNRNGAAGKGSTGKPARPPGGGVWEEFDIPVLRAVPKDFGESQGARGTGETAAKASA